MFNSENIKKDFPIFENYEKKTGKPLVYLDNAASSQTPKQVVEAMDEYYFGYRSNVHRSPYDLSEEATEAYEGVRAKVALFIGAKTKEIIFTSGATIGVNMLVYMLERYLKLKKGDEIVVSVAEHHSNIVPFQELARRTGAKLKIIPLLGTDLDYEKAEQLISSKTKIIAMPLASNVLGTIYDVGRVVKKANEVGSIVIVDASKAIGHMNINVRELECDFLFASGHKMLGPTGTGILYGKEDLLEKLYPSFFCGGVIEKVSVEWSTYNKIPTRFEAGTPNVAGVIGLGAAIGYVEKLGIEEVRKHSKELVAYAGRRLSEIEGVHLISEKNEKKNIGIVSFTIDGVHPHDVAEILGRDGIAIRGGHHCAMPLMKHLGVSGVCRASFYVYNDIKDVDKLVGAIVKAKMVFGK